MSSAPKEGRRLYVGGLPRFHGQTTSAAEIRELFKGMDVEVVSKMISPHESTRELPGNHYYCFVDLATNDEAMAAIHMLDGFEKWGWNLRVSMATGMSGKFDERNRVYVGNLPDFPWVKTFENDIQSMFATAGFEVCGIGKLHTPSQLKGPDFRGDNVNFCFVELKDGGQADLAIEKLDGISKWGAKLKIGIAHGNRQQVGGGWGENRQVRLFRRS